MIREQLEGVDKLDTILKLAKLRRELELAYLESAESAIELKDEGMLEYADKFMHVGVLVETEMMELLEERYQGVNFGGQQ